jgi:hypothetical protein
MKTSALLLLLVASLNVGAQVPPSRFGRIAGTVTDRANGQALGDVQVIVRGTSYGIRTKENGQYIILGVPPGTYTVIAQRADYSAVEIGSVAVGADMLRTVDIQMSRNNVTFQLLPPYQRPAPAPPRSMAPTPAPIVEQGTLGRPPEDPISRCLVPPETIMAHQGELNLEDAQRTKLIAETSKAQAKFTEVQWTMGSEQQKLEQLLAKPSIDEPAALKQLERIMSIEQDLKRSQMTLLIRVKNTLTPVQLKTIADLPGQGQRGYGRCGT